MVTRTWARDPAEAAAKHGPLASEARRTASGRMSPMQSRRLVFGVHWLAIASSGAHSVADTVLIFGMSAPGAVVYVVLGVAAFW